MDPPPAGSPPRVDSPGPPLYRRTEVRVACVQYDPKLGMVQQNAAKVESMVQHLAPNSIDLLVLPEMALSGYMFTSPASILPHLEPQRIGPTALLCRKLAKRLGCCVIAGYPEVLPDKSNDDASSAGPSSSASASGSKGANLSAPASDDSSGDDEPEMESSAAYEERTRGTKSMDIKGEALGVGYNSALVVDKKGEVVGNYRKTFRFETDKNWAREGDGFRHFDLGGALGRVGLGICMDMNPRDFVAPWDAFELANYARDNYVDTLVVPMNWLDPPLEPPNVAPPQDPSAPSEATLNYWAARLTPLHDPTPDYAASAPPSAGGDGKEVVFVACNRVGTEEGTKFVGTSCVMTLSSDPSRIELVDCCNISEERVMVATVT